MLIENIDLGDGHSYSVEVDENGKVVKTACRGRWPLTVTSTGSKWLDGELQHAADLHLEKENE